MSLGLKLYICLNIIYFFLLDEFREYWVYVENFGVPALSAIAGIAWLSLGFYLWDCRNMRLMEKELKKSGNLRNFEYRAFAFSFIGPRDWFYSFRRLSNINPEFMKVPMFQEQVQMIRHYRKFYRIIFPALIIIAAIGVSINELIIDK